MTSLNVAQPLLVNAPVSAHSAVQASKKSPWKMADFKKAYTGLSYFFNWGEKLSGPGTAPFFSGHCEALKMHASTFNIPGWFENISKLYHDVAEMRASKNRKDKNKAIKKIVFTSIDFTSSSVQLAQCLNDTHLINLEHLSPALPRALTGISAVGRMIVSVNNLFEKYIKTYLQSRKNESRSLSIHQKWDKNSFWKVLEVLRNVIGFISAIISLIIFFFAVHMSPYVSLSFSTFTFAASIAAELHESL